MPERKLIYADTVVEKLSELILMDDHEKKVLESFVEKCMAVDAVPVVHGRWIGKEEKLWNIEKPVVTGWECSECGVWGHYTYNYCPNCGAKMDGVSDG
jgi:hypothetical protein